MTDTNLPKGSKPTRQYRKLTARETVAVMALLDTHLTPVGERVVQYHDGWDDSRVAGQALTDFPGRASSAVAHLRLTEFGELQKASPPPAGDARLKARVEVLERAVRGLCDALGAPPEQFGL